jgi:hypothetical protein
MALRALPVEALSLPLSHSPHADRAKGPAATDTRALADALLAKAQEATDPATVRAARGRGEGAARGPCRTWRCSLARRPPLLFELTDSGLVPRTLPEVAHVELWSLTGREPCAGLGFEGCVREFERGGSTDQGSRDLSEPTLGLRQSGLAGRLSPARLAASIPGARRQGERESQNG